MRLLFQKEWFGIKFIDFAEVSARDLAGEAFYSGFYTEFYKKYSDYEALPEYWKAGKHEVAEHIADVVLEKENVLSIGCGNGYIEHLLLNIHDYQGRITALEPGVAGTQWISSDRIRLLHGFFPECVEKTADFDFAYASGIDYVFTDAQYSDFLSQMKVSGIKDFLLTIVITPDESMLGTLKYMLKRAAWKLGIYDPGQFWGYLRSLSEHRSFIENAGMKVVDQGRYDYGPAWIRLTVE
jgi:hypothetical protein